MGQIEKTIEVYERLRKNIYRISIEDGTVIDLKFFRENYHHLAGYQHLGDFPDISAPLQGTDQFYREIKNKTIKESQLRQSTKFESIAKRIEFFGKLEEILMAGESKIIVEFDDTKVDSIIKAIYFLYKREGTPYSDDYIIFILFIGYDYDKHKYFPTTYIVEDSPKYLSGQDTYYCTIEVIPRKKKKRT